MTNYKKNFLSKEYLKEHFTRLKKILLKNLEIKILAFLIALMLWYYVTQLANK